MVTDNEDFSMNVDADDRERLLKEVKPPIEAIGYLNETMQGIHIKCGDDIYNIHSAHLPLAIINKYTNLRDFRSGKELSSDRLAYDPENGTFKMIGRGDANDCYVIKWKPMLVNRMDHILSSMADIAQKESRPSLLSTATTSLFNIAKNWYNWYQGSQSSNTGNTENQKDSETFIKEFRKNLNHEQENGFMRGMSLNQKEAMIESIITQLEDFMGHNKRGTVFEEMVPSNLSPPTKAILSSPGFHMLMLHGWTEIAGLSKIPINSIHAPLFLGTLVALDHIAKTALRQPYSTTPVPDVLNWTLKTYRDEHEKQMMASHIVPPLIDKEATLSQALSSSKTMPVEVEGASIGQFVASWCGKMAFSYHTAESLAEKENKNVDSSHPVDAKFLRSSSDNTKGYFALLDGGGPPKVVQVPIPPNAAVLLPNKTYELVNLGVKGAQVDIQYCRAKKLEDSRVHGRGI